MWPVSSALMMSSMLTIPTSTSLARIGTPEMRWAFIRCWIERRVSAGVAVMGGPVIASRTRNSKTSTWAKETCRFSPTLGVFSIAGAGGVGSPALPFFKVFSGTMAGLRAVPASRSRTLLKRLSPLACSITAATRLCLSCKSVGIIRLKLSFQRSINCISSQSR